MGDARPALVKNLTTDAMTAKVVDSLRRAEVTCVLLRGPVIARRLYPDEEVRTYADCDLLIRHADLPRAGAVAAALGMRRDARDDVLIPAWERHHDDWQLARPRFYLELHWTLIHVGVGPHALWEVFERHRRAIEVCGVEVWASDDALLAVILALHAAQHGEERDLSKPPEDLRRAVRAFAPEVWRAASRCAVELDAADAFAAGLRMIPAGAELAATLALPDEPGLEVMLTTGRAGRGARQVDRLVHARGLRTKVHLIWRGVFPPESRKSKRPIKVDRRHGAVAGYGALPFRAVALLASGTVRWRRARRVAARPSSD